MSFWDKIVETGKDLKSKTNNLVNTTKLQADISKERTAINNLFMQIGKEYYEQFQNDAENPFAEAMGKITAAKAKIEELNGQIYALKGLSCCPKCGSAVAVGSLFCPTCGTKMPEKVEETVEEVSEEVEEAVETVAEKAEEVKEEVCEKCEEAAAEVEKTVEEIKDAVE